MVSFNNLSSLFFWQSVCMETIVRPASRGACDHGRPELSRESLWHTFVAYERYESIESQF